MASIVHFDERYRRRVRRRRWLREIDRRLGYLERSVSALQAEQVAAELVTVGRQLVRLLQDFDREWRGRPDGADAPTEPGAAEAEPILSDAAQARETASEPYGDGCATASADAPRVMSYPQFWEMIAVALDELAGQMEQLSMEAVQRAVFWQRSRQQTLLEAGGLDDGRRGVPAARRVRRRSGLTKGDPGDTAH